MYHPLSVQTLLICKSHHQLLQNLILTAAIFFFFFFCFPFCRHWGVCSQNWIISSVGHVKVYTKKLSLSMKCFSRFVFTDIFTKLETISTKKDHRWNSVPTPTTLLRQHNTNMKNQILAIFWITLYFTFPGHSGTLSHLCCQIVRLLFLTGIH